MSQLKSPWHHFIENGMFHEHYEDDVYAVLEALNKVTGAEDFYVDWEPREPGSPAYGSRAIVYWYGMGYGPDDVVDHKYKVTNDHISQIGDIVNLQDKWVKDIIIDVYA